MARPPISRGLQALFEEMERDANVFCMGEDIGVMAAHSK
jgi:pyruvate/2-oxoglutarate/acetoin dehydrogenase E1 component